MAYIDENGLLQTEPGDRVRVVHRLRPSSYGALIGGRPEILVWHLTGSLIPEGCDSHTCDGTDGMAKRIEEMRAKYYAHGLLARDALFEQNIPFLRAAIHVAGRFSGKETNRIANGIEVVNWGYAHADDGDFPGNHHIDPDREDARPHGRLTWQMLTMAQNTAILDIAEAWMRWAQRPIDDVLRGHHDVDTGSSHVDPGPELRAYLDTVVRAHLERVST